MSANQNDMEPRPTTLGRKKRSYKKLPLELQNVSGRDIASFVCALEVDTATDSSSATEELRAQSFVQKDVEIPLANLNADQLRLLCRRLGIRGASSATRNTCRALIAQRQDLYSSAPVALLEELYRPPRIPKGRPTLVEDNTREGCLTTNEDHDTCDLTRRTKEKDRNSTESTSSSRSSCSSGSKERLAKRPRQDPPSMDASTAIMSMSQLASKMFTEFQRTNERMYQLKKFQVEIELAKALGDRDRLQELATQMKKLY